MTSPRFAGSLELKIETFFNSHYEFNRLFLHMFSEEGMLTGTSRNGETEALDYFAGGLCLIILVTTAPD